MWRCEDVDQQMWRCEDVVRCRSADVKVWRCRSADVKVWRCSITPAFLRRTLRRRSREKHHQLFPDIQHSQTHKTHVVYCFACSPNHVSTHSYTPPHGQLLLDGVASFNPQLSKPLLQPLHRPQESNWSALGFPSSSPGHVLGLQSLPACPSFRHTRARGFPMMPPFRYYFKGDFTCHTSWQTRPQASTMSMICDPSVDDLSTHWGWGSAHCPGTTHLLSPVAWL